METTKYSTMNVATAMSANMVAEPATEMAVAASNDRQFLDFDVSKVQTLTLEQLARTEKENDYNGNPLMGIITFSSFSKYRRCAPNAVIAQRYGICLLPTTKTAEHQV